MSAVLRYTAARLALFAFAFGLLWGAGWRFLVWDEVSVLWTALVALALSGIASWFLLQRLRDELSAHVAGRAARVASAIEESRRAEDP